ncbi:ketopantoate reductase family protein [Thalassotalea marina]|uniref:2-dehydropantoate 2-reductase n=1 Tax=Thalassotalea marina TaxID=1673741 RepID=A0A919BCU6_9GAMM|nr:2-dehydropantoate 2-reductase [Thalassotalea marina]GHF83201.1 2-dehydropantoate 2-reductase [Thalassotalea marina]
MNVTIVGQGAIGLLWYHHLSKMDHQLNLMCSARAKNIPDEMHFFDIEGKATTSKIFQADIDSLASSNVIIFCLKAYQVIPALAQYLPAINQQADIILCHNGILPKELLIPWNNTHRLYQLLTSHGCKKTGDFAITHTGLGQSQLGSIYGSKLKNASKSDAQLTAELHHALPDVSWHQNISHLQWLKLAVNCVINPITALENIDNGDILKTEYQQQIKTLCKEIATVAISQQINLNPQKLLELVYKVANNTAKNCSSMRADLIHQRQTENEYINGFIYRMSQEHHLPCPVNNALYQQIAEREKMLGITVDKP